MLFIFLNIIYHYEDDTGTYMYRAIWTHAMMCVLLFNDMFFEIIKKNSTCLRHSCFLEICPNFVHFQYIYKYKYTKSMFGH